MSRRNRPSAFEITYGERLPDRPPPGASTLKRASSSGEPHTASSSVPSKRRRVDLPEPLPYQPPSNVIAVQETADLLVEGEDESEAPDPNSKPVRILTDFAIFDPKHGSEMISLEVLEDPDGLDRDFVAAGRVAAYMAEGDDDEEEDEDLASEGTDSRHEDSRNLPFVRLGSIFCTSIDCQDPNDPVWIETEFAWYILRTPSERYYQFFRHFYLPRRMTQLIIATLTQSNTNISSIEDLLHWLTATHTILGRSISVEDIWCSLLPHFGNMVSSNTYSRIHIPLGSHPLPPPLDGTVTPQPHSDLERFYEISTTLFSNLKIKQLPTSLLPQHKSTSHKRRLHKFVSAALAFKTAANSFARAIKPMRRIGDRASPYYEQVVVGDTTFSVGDVTVIIPDLNKASSRIINVQKLPGSLDNIIPDADLHTYFWFAKIISIHGGDAQAHVQWFEHGSFTALQEFANPQQLYLNMLCDSIPLRSLLGVVKVHFKPENPSTIPSDEYFCCSTYSHSLACVKDLPESWNSPLVTLSLPPDNCPVCHIQEEAMDQSIRSLRPLAEIGQIVGGLDFGPAAESLSADSLITVQVIGRMSVAIPLLPDVPADVQEVYITKEKKKIAIGRILQPCLILPYSTLGRFKHTLGMFPSSFYFRFQSSSLTLKSWRNFKPYNSEQHYICKDCTSRVIPLDSEGERQDLVENFIALKRQSLRALDLFSGCGAFSLGMAKGSELIKVAYAIEISPSAAQSFMQVNNSPAPIQMYNNCANIVLRHFIKEAQLQGHDSIPPTQLYNDGIMPPPLKPGDVDMMMIGFPCQSHSGLNKYKKANDAKSNLMLTALSYVDFLRPKFLYFENVRGFLQFNTGSRQAGLNRVEGGIDMGGLKFLMRALDELGYQYHFALLQAAHYGTPQRRVRFFLVASQQGLPLPAFPQPSYFSQVVDSLSIQLPIGASITPVAQKEALSANLQEIHLSNPAFAAATRGHLGGAYSRLDKDQLFHTTVTNVNPTAKQSHILNPWCKRIVTVRELARSQGFPDSFVFHAKDDSLVTMHRQIGNAVPWPVSAALGRELTMALYKEWLDQQRQ
ncbi:hypothetical protein ONZ45_g7139 [Pleurotus djamor]|nr:hypothetical protein ONZ45_g7139 [Pleurotus djamor]